jgi:uncharacterized protein (DUF302 family)
MTTAQIATDHVDIVSAKDFDTTVEYLAAALGKASTGELMERLAHSQSWEDYAEQCASLAGSSGLIEIGHLNWGEVLSLSGVAMKARCFIVGNPLTAQKLLSAGGAKVGLYLPAKILVFEANDGKAHVAYDTFGSLMKPFGIDALDRVASAIDTVLKRLAFAAAN